MAKKNTVVPLRHPNQFTALMQSFGIKSQTPAVSAGGGSDEGAMPWEDIDFVPRTKSGAQKSPNMIRNALQRYIDECKANGTDTQTGIIQKMGVNNNSFRRFMNPKTYKNPNSAFQNSTYWAAAKLLEKAKYEKEQAKKNNKKKSGKRTAESDSSVEDETAKKARIESTSTSVSSSPVTISAASASVTATPTGTPPKKTRAEMKREAADLVQRICAVEGIPDNSPVYDSCPQLVTKIKNFLQKDGMTKKLLLDAFGGINCNSMNTFLAGKNQDQCVNVTYRRSFTFFEKLRLLEGAVKSNARLKNESEYPNGFSLEKDKQSAGLIFSYDFQVFLEEKRREFEASKRDR